MIEVTKTIKTKYHVTVTHDDIVEYLKSKGHDVPGDCVVTFKVPGGGDWSHMDVDIDDENPVKARWETTETNYGD